MIRNVSYSAKAFSQPETLIAEAKEVLQGVEFDTMVGQGLSGSLVIPTLAKAMGKHFAIIRKEGENSHGNYVGFEGEIGNKWIFVDDFVSSGATFRRVYSKVRELAENRNALVEFKGIYSYQFPGFRPVELISHLIPQ